ncbi:MAG: PilZ domain-containing protein [Pseudomonadota bacterium]
MTNGESDKRKYPRIPVYMKILNDEGEMHFGFSYAKNISKGGIGLETRILLEESFHIEKGMILTLKFKLPTGNHVNTVKGKVIRIDEKKKDDQYSYPMLGIEFIDVSKVTLVEIDKYLVHREVRSL